MLLELALALLVGFLLFYRYVSKQFGKWETLGVPCIKGRFPCGSNTEVLFNRKNMTELYQEHYNQFYEEDYYGTYMFGKPVLHIKSMELIKEVMVKNFNNYVDRNDQNMMNIFDGGETDQRWHDALPNLCGEEWKEVRSTFSPIFTSGKMKGMLKYIEEVGSRLNQEIGVKADSGEDFELKVVFGKFSVASLATCAFGIDPNSSNDGTSIFLKHAARIFTNTTWDIVGVISRLIPGVQPLHKWLNISILKPQATQFFHEIILQVIKHRRKTGERKNDLLDLMVDCMEADTVVLNEEDSTDDQYHKDMKLDHKKKNRGMDELTVVSTAWIFLVAGYDTTAMTLAIAVYHLAKQPDLQAKLQEEIDQAFEDNDGKLPDYEILLKLPYLEMCLLEALRIQPAFGGLLRVCTSDCTLGDTGVQIRKGDLVNIPVIGVHRDEQYYPNPDQFNPENFSKEARQARSPYTFLAFGQGPRACIGMRFAMLEAKLALMEVFHNYTFLPSKKNPEKLAIDPDSQMGYIKGGLYAKIIRRK